MRNCGDLVLISVLLEQSRGSGGIENSTHNPVSNGQHIYFVGPIRLPTFANLTTNLHESLWTTIVK